MRLLQLPRFRPVPSPEPVDRNEAAAAVLERFTHGTGQSVLYAYKAQARRRQQQRAGTNAPPTKGTSESRSTSSSSAVTPQTPAPFAEPVPSAAPAPVPAPNFEHEQLRAFYLLGGAHGDEVDELIRAAAAWEPEDDPPEYVW